jgi:hypothetical protein
MEYTKKAYDGTLKTPLEETYVTFVWGTDGWRYVPELNIRDRFTDKTYIFESWEGNLPLPEYIEKGKWFTYSHSPRIWREQGEEFDELFEQKVSIPKRTRNTRAQQASHQ